MKHTIQQFNQGAKIIETVRSQADLRDVIATDLFDFEEAESNSKWLNVQRDDHQLETKEEHKVSSFLYKRDRPFNPEKLHKLLEDNFMLHVVNPDSDDEDDYADETDEQYEARLAQAKA